MNKLLSSFIAILLISCAKQVQTPPLAGQWFANPASIDYLNLERLALDFRTDSTYRYYYRSAPVPPFETGQDYTEGGRYSLRSDTIHFSVIEANGLRTAYNYSRKFRILPDTTEWPLRVTYHRNNIDFEVYFRAEK